MIDPGMPILVVDDFATMVKIIRNLLKQIGFENIDDASDGASALEGPARKHTALLFPTGTWSP
jgi:two-component system chemotaxis response regulator CheY